MLPRVQTHSKDLQFVQDNVDKELSKLQGAPLTGGQMIDDVSLTSGGDNVVNHTLRSTPAYFMVTNIDANANVWQTAATSSTITLRCSANCTVSIWVST